MLRPVLRYPVLLVVLATLLLVPAPVVSVVQPPNTCTHISCYVCHSEINRMCKDPLLPGSMPLTDCSREEYDEQYCVCEKVITYAPDNATEPTVVRSCGTRHLRNNPKKVECTYTEKGVTCECKDKDGCNHATTAATTSSLGGMLAAALAVTLVMSSYSHQH